MPDENNLKGGKIYFFLGFQRFQSFIVCVGMLTGKLILRQPGRRKREERRGEERKKKRRGGERKEKRKGEERRKKERIPEFWAFFSSSPFNSIQVPSFWGGQVFRLSQCSGNTLTDTPRGVLS
jgi:hypothetical protein